MKKRLIIAAVLSSMMVLTACSGKSDDGTITITNVSYDPTREFYEKYNANPHRGAYSLSIEATEVYEDTRTKIAKFINDICYIYL